MKHYINHIHHSKNRELNEMYVAMSMRSFAISLIGIFIPIYLFTIGYSLRNIFLFYIMANTFQFVGDYLSGHGIARYGAKHLLIASYPMMAVNLTMLVTMKTFHWPLWALALTTAVALNLFWTPYHDDFSKAKDKKSAGRQVGRWIILSEVCGAFGPLLGGIIAQRFGMTYGIIAALVIVVGAMIPLLGKHEIVPRKPFNRSACSVKKYYKDLIAYGGLSLEGMTVGVVWPLFLYFFIRDFAKVGFIVTMSFLLVIFLSLLIGKLTDQYGKERAMKTGSVVTFFTAGSRVLTSGVSMAYVIGTVSSLSQIFLLIPFYSVFYIHADKEPRTEYVTLMEMSVDVFRGILYGIMYASTFFLPVRYVFLIAFCFAAVGALTTSLIARSGKSLPKQIKTHREIAKARV